MLDIKFDGVPFKYLSYSCKWPGLKFNLVKRMRLVLFQFLTIECFWLWYRKFMHLVVD